MCRLLICVRIGTASNRAYEKEFDEFENDVDGAFLYLLDKLETLWEKSNYHSLQKLCIRDARLSESLRKNIKEEAPTLDEMFDLLKTSPYFTWFEIRILKRMANVAKVSEAKCLIKSYENYAFNKPCSEVQPYFHKHYIHSEHLTLVTAKLNKNFKNIIVGDLVKYCHGLDSIADLPSESFAIVNNEGGCVEISAIIPTCYAYHAYNQAKKILLKLRQHHIQYLKVGAFPELHAYSDVENQLYMEAPAIWSEFITDIC